MSFSTNAAIWDQLAHDDPLWAILTDPLRKGGRWSLEDFMATGEDQITTVLGRAKGYVDLDFSGTALDFGCGVGRLTRALSRRFARCVGCDVSPRMVELATEMAPANCRFAVSGEPPLPFPDKHFAFIYSDIVLQHIPEPYSLGYMRDFVRLLVPGGVAIFQVQFGIAGQSVVQRLRRKLPIRTWLGMKPPQRNMGIYHVPRGKVMAAISPATLVDEVFNGAMASEYNGLLRYMNTMPQKGTISAQLTIRA